MFLGKYNMKTNILRVFERHGFDIFKYQKFVNWWPKTLIYNIKIHVRIQ